MPTISFKAKIVRINEGTRTIALAAAQALRETGAIDSFNITRNAKETKETENNKDPNAQALKSALLPENPPEDVPGLLAKMKRLINNVFGADLENVTQFTLPSRGVHLAVIAYNYVMNVYQTLNKVMAKEFDCRRTEVAQRVEAKEISDPFVLMYEIYMRLVTIACSGIAAKVDSHEYQKAGNCISAAIDLFIDKLAPDVILFFSGKYGRQSPLAAYFFNVYDTSEIFIETNQIALVIRQTFAPINLFEGAFDHIERFRFGTLALIAAYTDLLLVKQSQKTSLSDRASLQQGKDIITAYEQLEDNLVALDGKTEETKEARKNRTQSTLLDSIDFSKSRRFQAITHILKNIVDQHKNTPLQPIAIQIIDLYQILQETNVVYRTIQRFHNMVDIGNWFPFFLNMVMTAPLEEMAEQFSQHCKDTLQNACKHIPYLFSQEVTAALYNLRIMSRLREIKIDMQRDIQQLDDPSLRETVWSMIGNDLIELTELEKVAKGIGLLSLTASFVGNSTVRLSLADFTRESKISARSMSSSPSSSTANPFPNTQEAKKGLVENSQKIYSDPHVSTMFDRILNECVLRSLAGKGQRIFKYTKWSTTVFGADSYMQMAQEALCAAVLHYLPGNTIPATDSAISNNPASIKTDAQDGKDTKNLEVVRTEMALNSPPETIASPSSHSSLSISSNHSSSSAASMLASLPESQTTAINLHPTPSKPSGSPAVNAGMESNSAKTPPQDNLTSSLTPPSSANHRRSPSGGNILGLFNSNASASRTSATLISSSSSSSATTSPRRPSAS